MSNRSREAAKAGASATVGAVVGKAVVVAKGATAVGALKAGGGLGGMTAGPVGVVAGAVAGLALYGLYRVFSD